MGFQTVARLYNVRKLVCSIIAYLVGYIFPFLESVRAVTHADHSATLELLAHWTILTLISVTQSIVLSSRSGKDAIPPELTLLFMLWLTLPQFKGTEVIRKRLILPLYLKHEHTIDAIMSDITQKSKEFALRHSQNILYQLLLSQDGLAQGLLSTISKGISFIDGFDTKSSSVPPKPLRIGQKILKDFTMIMREGVVVKAGPDINHLRFVTCSIHEQNNNYFSLKALDDDSTYFLPILLIQSMDVSENYGDNRESILLTFHKKIKIHGNINDIQSYTKGIFVSSLCIDMPNNDCDGFVGGVQIYSSSVKTRSLRKIDKMTDSFARILVRIKFSQWQKVIQSERGPIAQLKEFSDYKESSLDELSRPRYYSDGKLRR